MFQTLFKSIVFTFSEKSVICNTGPMAGRSGGHVTARHWKCRGKKVVAAGISMDYVMEILQKKIAIKKYGKTVE